MKHSIGIAGLAVMGENLVLNIASRGFPVAVYNRTYEKTRIFLNGRGAQKQISGFASVAEFVDSLETPRKIMMMLKAGEPVDLFIEQLLPLLDAGDVIIDGGNSHYLDTERRVRYLEAKGVLYIGTGVSGGEKGALEGPSIMPGGSEEAWPLIKPIFQAAAARVENDICCAWMGKGGAGHFVKMVHNGIEYGDMQLICEAYHFMKSVLAMKGDEIQEVFRQWNSGDLQSYLIEITADITGYRDENNELLLESILDVAGQKGTGKWTVDAALENGMPLSLISESVFARCLSTFKELRNKASQTIQGPEYTFNGDREKIVHDLGKALYVAKIISYTQGFALLKAASDDYQWKLEFGEIAAIWRGGCIIRSIFLDKISEAFRMRPDLENMLFDGYFKKEVSSNQGSLRHVVATGVQAGIPLPCHAAALHYFDGLRTSRLPANLLQAQRDYFGAHMYERIDGKRGEFFHTNWTGKGGGTTSTAYST